MGIGVLVVLDDELARCQREDLLCVVIRARCQYDVVHNGIVMPRTMITISLHEGCGAAY
jgi:hypothetical protein